MTTLNVKGLRFSKLVGFDENNFTPKWRYGILCSENHLYTFICKLSRDDQRKVHPLLGTYTAATMMIMRADCNLVYVDKRMLSKL